VAFAILLSGERTRPRVLAMAPSPSQTSSAHKSGSRLFPRKDRFGEAPKPAREARALPRSYGDPFLRHERTTNFGFTFGDQAQRIFFSAKFVGRLHEESST
jgi:hypothetical protein